MLGCLFMVSGLSMYNMHAIVSNELGRSRTLYPANAMATDFERQILNARIFFIYHVTIQKSGALQQGWDHYHTAEDQLRQLATLVQQHEELRDLRPQVAKLTSDLDDYSISTQAMLAMVQGGALSGPVYDAQVKDWASHGAVLVTDAGSVEALTASAGQQSSDDMVSGLQTACKVYGLLFLLGAPPLVFVVWRTVRKIHGVLSRSVAELSDVSLSLVATAKHVADESQSLAASSSQQAVTIEQTASASSEISHMASRTTTDSKTTAEMMVHAEETLGRTNLSLAEMVGAMERIQSASHKISKIIQVIDGIAFQTNILALNAAVEAARAGEAGMGFAVVADEVRGLAQRSAQAAKDTADLIVESIGHSNEGKSKVDQVAAAIQEISSQIAKIKCLVDDINRGSVEQSGGIEHIADTIKQLEDLTQRNAADARDGATAAIELNEQASCMERVVERLSVLVDGNNTHPPSTRRAASPDHELLPGLSRI